MANNKFLKIGKIINVHGIFGELKVQAWCDSLEDFCSIEKLYLSPNDLPLQVQNTRVHTNYILIKFQSIDTREKAEKLKQKCLYAEKSDIPIKENHYFIEDLKNSEIFDFKTNKKYGILKNVWNAGANDIYTVLNDDGKEYYVPIIEGTVKEIDLEKEQIFINPIEGIFD